MEETVRFVNVFSAALAAGGTAVVLVVLLPALRELPDPAALRLHQLVTPLFYRYLPLVTVLSAVSALVALAIDPDLTTVQGLTTLAGFICTAGVATTTFLFNMRMNRVIGGWSPDAVPPEYASMRARWDSAHVVRTAFAVAALSLYLVAALAD